MVLMTLFYRAAPLSLVILFLLAPSPGHADLFTGGETTYTITKGDSLILIAAKVGVDWQVLARENNIEPGSILKIGRVVKVNTRRIVPKVVEKGIIINIPDRMLYYFIEGNSRTLSLSVLACSTGKHPQQVHDQHEGAESDMACAEIDSGRDGGQGRIGQDAGSTRP